MSVEFDGTNDYITCGTGLDNLGTMSIATWLYSDNFVANDDYQHLIVKGDWDAPTATGWMLYTLPPTGDTTNLRFLAVWDEAVAYWDTDDPVILEGIWQHIAVTYNSGATANNPIFYINGSVVANTELVAPAGTIKDDSTATVVVGQRYPGTANAQFDGQFEDLRVANKVWTAEEIVSLVAGYRGPLGGEALWYSMNEARSAAGAWEATTLTNNTNYLPDLSVNSNDGNPVNGPVGRASKAPRYGVAV